jgi:endonuclease/exonuclease/phosphatase family metal-dependent hydrolase
LEAVETRHVILNSFRYRRAQARRSHFGLLARLAWGKERRVCQVVRVRRHNDTLVVANAHLTGSADKRIPDAELLRAAVFVDGVTRPNEPVLLCGDLNLSVRNSRMLAELTSSQWGFGGPTPTGIDHVLVRGLGASAAVRWPLERRISQGRLLSDHAPVEREVAS